MSRINKKCHQTYLIGDYSILIRYYKHNDKMGVRLIEDPHNLLKLTPSHKYNFDTIIATIAYFKMQVNKVYYHFRESKLYQRQYLAITESDFFKKLREIDECQKPSARLKNKCT